jgi:vancomycin resistance protein YoaR
MPRPGPRGRLALLVLGLLVLVLGVGAALGATDDGDGVPDRVRVAGVDVSGLSPDEVERAVRYRAQQLMKVPVVVARADAPGVKVEATRASLGARPQIRRAVDAALEDRSIGGRVLARLGVAPTREVDLGFTLNPRKVDALVRRVSGQVNDPPVPARLKVTDDDIDVLPGKAGFGIDNIALRERIRELPTDPIEVTLGPLEPPVSDEAAAAAREVALRVVATPVDVTLQGRGVTIEPAVLRSALRFEPQPPELRVALDPDVLYEDIADAFETRERPARDAAFRVSGSGTSVRLIPSRIGRKLDMEAIAAAIVESPGTRAVRARFEISRPELTTKEAKALRITELVSEFSTPYNCCEPRVTNIQRAAQILDGQIIPAGNAFSLNDALGPRTEDRGFVAAPQIAAGRLEDAVGGGVSQVATTMFNAAFFAGLELVDHTPHQFYISRYPEGREATVSLGGPELVFVNDWPAAILINAVASDNAITIRFFSTSFDRRVETETGERRDFVDPEIKETVNPELQPGERVVEQEMGGGGFTVDYTRKVWEGDELRRDETYTWTYSPQHAFVEVGPPAPKRPKPGRTTPEEPEPGNTTTEPAGGGGGGGAGGGGDGGGGGGATGPAPPAPDGAAAPPSP